METRTKVVVRKLPPVMDEADVRELVDSATGGSHTWFSFVQGKIRQVLAPFHLHLYMATSWDRL